MVLPLEMAQTGRTGLIRVGRGCHTRGRLRRNERWSKQLIYVFQRARSVCRKLIVSLPQWIASFALPKSRFRTIWFVRKGNIIDYRGIRTVPFLMIGAPDIDTLIARSGNGGSVQHFVPVNDVFDSVSDPNAALACVEKPVVREQRVVRIPISNQAAARAAMSTRDEVVCGLGALREAKADGILRGFWIEKLGVCAREGVVVINRHVGAARTVRPGMAPALKVVATGKWASRI
jgi:hypothetical protein